MIHVRVMQYWNDYCRKETVEKFEDLNGLEDWIFGHMRIDYSTGCGKSLLSFPKCRTGTDIYRISFRPDFCSQLFWIHQIEDTQAGILFSDGTYTSGRRHCTKEVRNWLAECRKRQENPEFNFAPDAEAV